MTLNCYKFIFRNFALLCNNGKRMKIDPPCQRRNCCALKVLFKDIYECANVDYVDTAAGHSSARSLQSKYSTVVDGVTVKNASEG